MLLILRSHSDFQTAIRVVDERAGDNVQPAFIRRQQGREYICDLDACHGVERFRVNSATNGCWSMWPGHPIRTSRAD